MNLKTSTKDCKIPDARDRPAGHLARGVTVVEVVTVVAVMGVLLSVAVPSFRALRASANISAATSDLLSHLHLARSEAIQRRARVVLCKSGNGESCIDTGGWEQGWIVFHDRNNDRIRQNSEPVLQRQAALPSGLRLSGNPSVAKSVSYGPVGSTLTPGGGFQAGTLTVCDESVTAGPAKQIVVAMGGRPRVQKAMITTCP